jgi:hypothetical protein
LHVLSTPPAFVLSQDQTLQENSISSSRTAIAEPKLNTTAIRITYKYVSLNSPRDLNVSRIDESASHSQSRSTQFSNSVSAGIRQPRMLNRVSEQVNPQASARSAQKAGFPTTVALAAPVPATRRRIGSSRLDPRVTCSVRQEGTGPPSCRSLRRDESQTHRGSGRTLYHGPTRGSTSSNPVRLPCRPRHTFRVVRQRRGSSAARACSLMDSNHQPSD